MEDQSLNWYLLQTKPNAHKLASDNLRRQGFEVFLPLIDKTIKRGGKFVDKKSPLFPSYLFMGTQEPKVPWKSINSTRGVSKCVTLDGIYRTVNNHIIEGLKIRCNQSNVIQGIDNIMSGDRVRIERGAFSDFICQVDKITDNKRAWVLINILQQQTKTNVSLDHISKII